MYIKKEYKFYYGHRNQELNDKCFRPHGHDAKLFVVFNVVREGNVTTLFNDFDKHIEPFLKNEFDHRFVIDVNDPLLPYFRKFEEDRGESLGLKVLPLASSVENVCFYLFKEITERFGFSIARIEYQETRTSTVVYDEFDFQSDLNRFASIVNNSWEEEVPATKPMSAEVSKAIGTDPNYLSLYDYYGKAAGSAKGKEIYEKAVALGIVVKSRKLQLAGGEQSVCLYPRTFLEEFFPKSISNKFKRS